MPAAAVEEGLRRRRQVRRCGCRGGGSEEIGAVLPKTSHNKRNGNAQLKLMATSQNNSAMLSMTARLQRRCKKRREGER